MGKLTKTLGAAALALGMSGCGEGSKDYAEKTDGLNQAVSKAKSEVRETGLQVHAILNSPELIDAQAQLQLLNEEDKKKKGKIPEVSKSGDDLLSDPATMIEKLEAREKVDQLWDK